MVRVNLSRDDIEQKPERQEGASFARTAFRIEGISNTKTPVKGCVLGMVLKG